MSPKIILGCLLSIIPISWATLGQAAPKPLVVEGAPVPITQSLDIQAVENRKQPSIGPNTLAQQTPIALPSPAFSQSTPLQESAYGLLGWQTATPIGQDRLLIQFGGVSFNNPNDFREVLRGQSNRSNDAHLDVVYGISRDIQLGIALSGKDDTIFANLVRTPSQLQIINNVIPIEAKWRFYNQNQLQASAIAGVELPNSFSALFFRANRSVSYSQNAAVGNGRDSILAEDPSVVFGLGFPVSYQATDKLRLHINPRVSFFPHQLAVTSTTGDPNAIKNARVGFDGRNLNYYGTVAGIGLGASYVLSPNLQIAADITPIISGRNSIDSATNGSFLSAKTVWNAGLQYTPNNRTALGLYVTNRYSATSSSPANLLVQPGGDWAVGLNVSYLQGNIGDRVDEKRSSYPKAVAFWSATGSYPSTVLPVTSILYQLGVGSQGQANPTIRYGLMDDVEIAISHNNTNRREMPIETSLMGRWGLLRDQGQAGFSGALGLGLIRIDGPSLQLGYSLYGETPISYRLPGNKLAFHATPKLVIPAQFQGVPRNLALSLGADYQVANNTQLFGSITPNLIGANQLVAGKSLAFQGNTPVYNLGVRQLFPSGNSTYGIELYYGNGAGSTGYQSMSALPGGDTQFGVRLSLLNGTP